MRAYPRYQDSGVEWLGEMPEHWEVRPLKSVLARNEGGVWGGDPEGDEGTIVLRSTEQTVDGGWSIDNPARRVLSARERREAVLAVGDLVVTKSSGSELHIGKTSLVTHREARLEACFSNFMQRLRCLPTFNPRLAWFLLNSPVGRQQLVFGSNTTTGLANLNGTILGDIVTPLPPLDEQRAIAAYLDRETERIDALVAKKRLLIERLEEYRTALITRTVTRGLPPEAARAAGLDPSPRLKPSGVEWLGEVPEHWEVKELRRLLAEPLKYGANEPAELDDPAFPRYVRITDIDDAGALREETFRSLPPEVAAPYLLEDGDVLLARSGATVGKSFLYQPNWGTCAYAGYLIRARVERQTVDARFVRYFTATSAYWAWLDSTYIQATIQNVSAERYASLTLPVPPLPEQGAIVAFLERETERVTQLVGHTEAAIERLQEYRTALITAAVTGKIDVRE